MFKTCWANVYDGGEGLLLATTELMSSWVLGACDRRSLVGSGGLRLLGARVVVVIGLVGRVASFLESYTIGQTHNKMIN